jgi:hypothetical protein
LPRIVQQLHCVCQRIFGSWMLMFSIHTSREGLFREQLLLLLVQIFLYLLRIICWHSLSATRHHSQMTQQLCAM